MWLTVNHNTSITSGNEIDVRSVLHGQVSFAAVSLILYNLRGYEWMQISNDSLKDNFENVNIM